MSKKKQRQIRTDFRKNRVERQRKVNFTRDFAAGEPEEIDSVREERISGKGELSRRRTVRAADETACADDSNSQPVLAVDEAVCLAGRVLKVNGLLSTVETADGRRYQCATRRLLKTISTDLRHVVVAGDHVLIRPADDKEGIIERVERRYGVLSRASRGRQHTIVANVDQLLIVGSAAEPYLKPNLIDRYLMSAEKAHIRPLIVINKIDLVEPAGLMPLVGVYSQMGYPVILTSARSGTGVDRLRRELVDRQTAVVGQSGVGKSSLLNATEPGLALRVASVSQETQKGRHTTTTAELLRTQSGGYLVDTPGIRQFQLWDIVPAEVQNYFRDLRPYVGLCKFPDCSHTHEEECAVKDAVADDLLDVRRYESYLSILEGSLDDLEDWS
ncbi:MAG: ribosome small subunit-dependent GTPase A [Pirellulales bacterium]|nr:ribosome small subunit-dependent GTPase A [Pirellulales bacterium]